MQRGEEPSDSLSGGMGRVIGIQQPLEDGDGDGAVKRPWSEPKALADILEEQVTLDLTLDGYFEHRGGNVDTDPIVTVLIEDFARETGSAADIEEVLCFIFRVECEEFDRSVSHFSLNGLNSGATWCGVSF